MSLLQIISLQLICLYVIHPVFWLPALYEGEMCNRISFVKGASLFPLVLGTGAREKRNEHAQTRSFITSRALALRCLSLARLDRHEQMRIEIHRSSI